MVVNNLGKCANCCGKKRCYTIRIEGEFFAAPGGSYFDSQNGDASWAKIYVRYSDTSPEYCLEWNRSNSPSFIITSSYPEFYRTNFTFSGTATSSNGKRINLELNLTSAVFEKLFAKTVWFEDQSGAMISWQLAAYKLDISESNYECSIEILSDVDE